MVAPLVLPSGDAVPAVSCLLAGFLEGRWEDEMVDLGTATTAADPGVPGAPIAEAGDRQPEPTPGDDGAVATIGDDELTALALAAEPATTADDDAVSYWEVVAPRQLGLLPEWYVGAGGAGSRRLEGWRRRVVWLLIICIGLINAAGLCITYGHVTLG